MLIQELIEICPESNMEHINTQWEHSSVLLLLVMQFRGLKLIDDVVNRTFLYAINTQRN